MNPRTSSFINSVEIHAGRQFNYREEIGMLIDTAEEKSLQSTFTELLFLSKFLTNAKSVLNRNRFDTQAIARLENEFRECLEKSVKMITILAGNFPSDQRKNINDRFLEPSKENFERIILLIEELSWFKNYTLDQTHI